MKRVDNYIHNDGGFTLIEAVVTILVIGIIVVPISTVFIGALEKNQETKEILIANQLSQQVLENLKSKSYDDLKSYFIDDSIPENTVNRMTLGDSKFPKATEANFVSVPEGYSVDVIFDTDQYVDAVYDISPPTSVELNTDITLTIGELDADDKEKNYAENNRSMPSVKKETTDSVFNIDYESDGETIKVQYGSKEETFESTLVNKAHRGNINIICKSTATKDPSITVDNKSDNEVIVNVYYEKNSSISPIVKDVPNRKDVHVNYSELTNKNNTKTMYFIGVEVRKGSIVLSSINTTRIED